MVCMTNAAYETTANATTQGANREGASLSSVMTDMLALGSAAKLRDLYMTEVYSGSWDRALAAFVALVQANINHHYATKFENLSPPKVMIATSCRGQRFLRLWSESTDKYSPGRNALGFVEPATGYLWKCATWKAPATNFPRASMYDLAMVRQIEGGIYFYDVRYQGAPIAPGVTQP